MITGDQKPARSRQQGSDHNLSDFCGREAGPYMGVLVTRILLQEYAVGRLFFILAPTPSANPKTQI
jgi:hypothetical protein